MFVCLLRVHLPAFPIHPTNAPNPLDRSIQQPQQQDAEESSLLQQALRRANRPRTRMGSVEALKAYVTKASADVFAIEDSYLRSVGEEMEEEAAEAATAVAVAP